MTLRDRGRVRSMVHMVDRKPMTATFDLKPKRRVSGVEFVFGFVAGFAFCAVVLAIGLTFLS